MPVKMQPTSVIKANLGIEPNGKVQKFFTNTCYRYMDKYVPKDNGILRENVTIDSNSITYEQEYAHAQYIGEVMVEQLLIIQHQAQGLIGIKEW